MLRTWTGTSLIYCISLKSKVPSNVNSSHILLQQRCNSVAVVRQGPWLTQFLLVAYALTDPICRLAQPNSMEHQPLYNCALYMDLATRNIVNYVAASIFI